MKRASSKQSTPDGATSVGAASATAARRTGTKSAGSKAGGAGRPGKTISAVARAFHVVEKLALVSSASLEELSRAAKLAKPTTYRFLMTLRDLGYVRKDDGDRWFLTMKLFAVGSKALDHIELPKVARSVAERLSADLGETVHMGVLDEGEALYVLKIESKYTIRMYSRVGKKIPLYCTAIGKVLLADMADDERAATIASMKLVPFTPHTLRDTAALERELERVRSEGFAVDAEEHEEGVACIAAPIRDHTGRAVAALSVSWPTFRFEEERRAEYRSRIVAATAEISGVLGSGV
jgi:IclR family KDG regulon transcriptional repressor